MESPRQKENPQKDSINNITTPCQLCRNNSIGASGNRYCADCYTNLITQFYIGKYPISGRELREKFRKKGFTID